MALKATAFLVVICCLQAAYTANKNKREDEYIPIKFPGPIREPITNKFGALEEDVPEECRGKLYCTVKPRNYPQDRFNAMFKGTKQLFQPKLVQPEFVIDRQGDPEDKDNCDSVVEYKPLYQVRTKRGDLKTVIQAPEENYLQLVRLETCKETGKPCFTALPSLPDIVTFCKQKYSVWEFLVADEKNGTEVVKTELPTCCSCNYKVKALGDK